MLIHCTSGVIRAHTAAVTADLSVAEDWLCRGSGFSSVGLSLRELSVNLTTLIKLENCHVRFPILLSHARVCLQTVVKAVKSNIEKYR